MDADDEVAVRFTRPGFDVTEGLPAEAHHHTSVRTFEHQGRQVSIETRYRIVIDGVEFPDPVEVGLDGTVHYHGLPQYAPLSAVDLVKSIIDRATDEAVPPPIGATDPNGGQQDHGGHDHGGHDHGDDAEGGGR